MYVCVCGVAVGSISTEMRTNHIFLGCLQVAPKTSSARLDSCRKNGCEILRGLGHKDWYSELFISGCLS